MSEGSRAHDQRIVDSILERRGSELMELAAEREEFSISFSPHVEQSEFYQPPLSVPEFSVYPDGNMD